MRLETGLGKALFGGMTKGQIAGRLAPDAIFGGMAAMQTPGDIGDKLIAGGTQFLGGGLGGLATARLAKGLGAGPGIETIADFMGSYGGDFAAIPVGDALQRGKDKVMGGEGRTAYERMSDQQQQQFADQIRQQTLMGAGLIPGIQGSVHRWIWIELMSFLSDLREATAREYGVGQEENRLAMIEARKEMGKSPEAPRMRQMAGSYRTPQALKAALNIPLNENYKYRQSWKLAYLLM